MSTNAVIGIMHGDKCKAVFLHWDGYISHTGKMLLKNYQDSAKVNHLVSLGTLCSLDVKLIPSNPESHSFDNPEKGVSVFYGRDRQQEGQEYQVFANDSAMFDFYDLDNYYVMKDGVWYYTDNYGEWITLADALVA